MSPTRVALTLAGVALAFAGCATVNPLEQAGNDFGKGLLAAMDKDAPKTVDALMKKVGDDIREDVLTDATNEKLATMASSTVSAFGEATASQLPKIRDEVLGKATEAELQKILVTLLAVMDAQSKRTVKGMMGEVGSGVEVNLLSPGTEKRLNEILASLGTTARGETRLAVDDVLSQQRNEQLRVAVATVMDQVVSASEEIRQKAHDELSFVQRNANITIALAGLVAAIIVFLVWREKEKNRMLVELLLGHVHAQSEDMESEIHAKLQAQAKQLGAHGVLRSALAKQGVVNGERGRKVA